MYVTSRQWDRYVCYFSQVGQICMLLLISRTKRYVTSRKWDRYVCYFSQVGQICMLPLTSGTDLYVTSHKWDGYVCYVCYVVGAGIAQWYSAGLCGA
jgi:hypothetical protein